MLLFYELNYNMIYFICQQYLFAVVFIIKALRNEMFYYFINMSSLPNSYKAFSNFLFCHQPQIGDGFLRY